MVIKGGRDDKRGIEVRISINISLVSFYVIFGVFCCACEYIQLIASFYPSAPSAFFFSLFLYEG